MPPQKAAKKTAKKAAKKTVKKAAGHHDPHTAARDAPRTFEHLGRVQTLSSFALDESESLILLTKAADAAYQAQHYKESADLLRAAEHLSFAKLYTGVVETVATELKQAIKEEFEHLILRSIEHSSHHEISNILLPLLDRMTASAKTAIRRGSYRSALEFARGAEALSHVHDLNANIFASPSVQKHLKA